MQTHPTQQQKARKLPPGVEEWHQRHCRSRDGGRCDCTPSYRAWIFDKRAHTKVRGPLFSGKAALTEAKRWRASATVKVADGKSVARSRITLREAAGKWLAGAEASPPTVLTRGGRPYKPGVLRGYRGDLERYVLPELGAHRL